jgi:hypothetical protein
VPSPAGKDWAGPKQYQARRPRFEQAAAPGFDGLLANTLFGLW